METQLNLAKIHMANLYERKWLVIYTRPRWEKKVDKLLKMQGIESYCPLREVQNQWADRKKDVSLPLFSSYVFVRLNLYEHSKVLYTLGVMGFVYYMGKPAIVRDNVIDEIKNNLTIYKDIEVVNLHGIAIGDNVRIKDGLLVNKLGKVVQIQGKNVLIVFDNISCALVTRIPLKSIAIENLKQDHEN